MTFSNMCESKSPIDNKEKIFYLYLSSLNCISSCGFRPNIFELAHSSFDPEYPLCTPPTHSTIQICFVLYGTDFFFAFCPLFTALELYPQFMIAYEFNRAA